MAPARRIMYAIIETGGKQYRVAKGDLVEVELLSAEAGQTVEFPKVLLVHNGEKISVGKPSIHGAKVLGIAEGVIAAPKVIAFKYKKRKNQRRKVGHRQDYLRVRITEIAGA